MEDLTKTQIVLLAILVSFVTSVATGIITTSLLDQAPPQVTRTINRVVEKTIERVSPPEGSGEKEVVRETVVVKEDDMVVQAIDRTVPSVVRIYAANVDTARATALAVGVVVDDAGTIVTDGSRVSQGQTYVAQLRDGSDVRVATVYDQRDEVAVLQPVADANAPSFDPVVLADQRPKLGQTVVAIGGVKDNAIAVGRVINLSRLHTPHDATTTATSSETSGAEAGSDIVTGIETDITLAQMLTGGPLVNLSGRVVGLAVDGSATSTFVPSSAITDALDAARGTAESGAAQGDSEGEEEES